MLKHSYVKWYSDSQADCTVARVGSMRKNLHEIALRVYQLCLEQKIEFEIDWIPRTELQRADFLSRLIDIDDWQITRQCFNTLEDFRGCHHWIASQIITILRFHDLFLGTGIRVAPVWISLYKIYPGKTV